MALLSWCSFASFTAAFAAEATAPPVATKAIAPEVVAPAATTAGSALIAVPESAVPQDASKVARQVDQLILRELTAAGVTPAGPANDEDFLRRVSFDIAGIPPTPEAVTRFGLSPVNDKRADMIDTLLARPEYGENWSRYWRDVVYLSATNMRGRNNAAVFESWLATQLNENRPWSAIVTDLLTATGDVGENGATALMQAHSASAEELAAESSRIFLGIQLQCANCHDHPSDIWKRDQFHQLAAYFPRVALRPVQMDGQIRSFEVVSVDPNRRPGGRGPAGPGGPGLAEIDRGRLFGVLDRNRDGLLSKEEAETRAPGNFLAQNFERLLMAADTNSDGKLSREEFLSFNPGGGQRNRGNGEYYMADLNDPTSQGTLIQPRFFVDESAPGDGLSDVRRRAALAASFTATNNPWFSRAIINRLWHEMLGTGFYMPVDDLGPTRSAVHPQALDLLAEQFVAHQYDIKWLIRTIALTETYQRQIRPQSSSEEAVPFASQIPTRLRADQLYSALTMVLGVPDSNFRGRAGRPGPGFAGSPRQQFAQIFTYDPSTPQEDLTGNVPQALFLMNSPQFSRLVSAGERTPLGRILRTYTTDQDAIAELYLLTLSREPTDRELKLSQQYFAEVADRPAAFEDLLWGLLNSSEFLSRR